MASLKGFYSMHDSTSLIAKLKADWFQLHDLDRGKRVAAIRRSGVSIREIARELGFSATNLRHLLETLNAPQADKALARQHLISTNELVRRAQAANARRAERHREILELERLEAAQKGADLISNWLLQTQLHGPSCGMIVEEVRQRLAFDEAAGVLPAARLLNITVNEIIRRTKPPELTDDSCDIIAWHAEWLLRWVFRAFPNSDLRWMTLDLALQKQSTR